MTDRILKDKVALITGAGSGVGRSMAKLFAESGATVVVVDVVRDRVEKTVAEISASGGKARGNVRDLSKGPEVDAMVEEAERLGRIDILCNNAGIMDGANPVAETSDELWERVLSVNLDAPFRASRKVLPGMLERRSGVILNTASIAGLFGGRAGAAYTVSKHGLIGLTKNIAASYGMRGIRCNSMVLGAVETAIGIGSDKPSTIGMESLNKSMATLPRMAKPEEIANLALFLASDAAGFVNGSCVVIDGGWTAF